MPDEAAVQAGLPRSDPLWLQPVAIYFLLPQVQAEHRQDDDGDHRDEATDHQIEQNTENGDASQGGTKSVKTEDGFALGHSQGDQTVGGVIPSPQGDGPPG